MNQVQPVDNQELVRIDRNQLNRGGFTSSGAELFVSVVRSYAQQLRGRSEYLANESRVGQAPEPNAEHVKDAADSLRIRYWRVQQNRWIICQTFEYVMACVVGAGASNLDKTIGIVAFIVGLIIGAFL